MTNRLQHFGCGRSSVWVICVTAFRFAGTVITFIVVIFVCFHGIALCNSLTVVVVVALSSTVTYLCREIENFMKIELWKNKQLRKKSFYSNVSILELNVNRPRVSQFLFVVGVARFCIVRNNLHASKTFAQKNVYASTATK